MGLYWPPAVQQAGLAVRQAGLAVWQAGLAVGSLPCSSADTLELTNHQTLLHSGDSPHGTPKFLDQNI